jgi:hypothetical protein
VLGRDGPLKVDVAEQPSSFTGRRGDTVYSAGHVPASSSGAPLPEEGHVTSNPRVYHCQVAGTHHMPSALADSRFDVGSRVQLRLAPGAPDDATAVGIWDATGIVQVGYVPATLSRTVAAALRGGEQLGGEVVRELRLGGQHGRRAALYVLIAPARRLELVYHGRGDAAGGSGAH